MSPPNPQPRVWAIVPAAGLGRRMGSPKQTLPYAGSTIAATVVATLLHAGVDGVIIVTRTEFRDGLQLPPDPRIRIAINDAVDGEMLDSIRIGLATLEEAGTAEHDGVIVVPADMPTLTAATCARCLAAYRAQPGRIAIASHAGVRGHPIIFPLSLRREVCQLTGGLRQLAQRSPAPVQMIACDDAGITVDVDTPAEYDRARDVFANQGRQSPSN